MSGIAEVLINLGYDVQGSDLAATALTGRLSALGARVAIGHDPDHIGSATVVVVSSAIQSDNPELVAARARGLPIVKRAEMLAELMRFKSNVAIAGTHGKTTTTTLVATLLEQGGYDPTVINGGIIRAYGSNARLGSREWMVVEADESDGTFLTLPATVAVVTNIDPEHMDHYGSFDALRNAFLSFLSTIPFYGFAVCCHDSSEVRSLVKKVTDRRVVTYGFSEHADVRITNMRIDGTDPVFDVHMTAPDRTIPDCRLPMPGAHNVSNAVAAMTVATLLGMEPAAVREALSEFRGVSRRFTRVGTYRDAMIIDDYGHHPVEIRAVLKAARQLTKGRIIAIHQPHRYTRLQSLFSDFCQCFADADIVAITDVYAAGESPIRGIDRDHLVRGLGQHGHPRVEALTGSDDFTGFIRDTAESGDMILCMGAGSISDWTHNLASRLEGFCHAT